MFDTFSSEYYHILAIKIFHMLIVILFWGREVRRAGGYLRDSPWKWLNMSTRAIYMAWVAGVAERVWNIHFQLTYFSAEKNVNGQGKIVSSSLFYGHLSRPIISGVESRTSLSFSTIERPEHLRAADPFKWVDICFTEVFFHTRIILLHMFPILCSFFF